MINVHPIADSTSVIPLYTTSFGNYPLTFFLFESTRGRSQFEVGLPPQDAVMKSPMGNRWCFHDNWKGDVYFVDKRDWFTTQVTSGTTSSLPTPVEYTEYRVNDPLSSIVGTYKVTTADSYRQLPYQLMLIRGYPYDVESWVEVIWHDTKTLDILIRYHRTYTGGGSTRYYIYGMQFVFDETSGLVDYSTGTIATIPQTMGIGYWPSPASPGPASPWSGLQTYLAHALVATDTITQFDLRLMSNWLHEFVPLEDINLWGDLCQEAIHDAQSLNINSLEYVRELFELKSSLIALWKLIRGKADSKSLSKLWLSAKYGLRLTYFDTKELYEEVTRKLPEWNKFWSYVRSFTLKSSTVTAGILSGVTIQEEYHYKIYYDQIDRGFSKLILDLMNWDVFPTMQNIWDLIPFSFVLDWFVDFENYFDIVDTAKYATLLPVLEVVKSRKITFKSVPIEKFLPINKAGRVVIADVDYVYYHRDIDPYLTIPRLKLDTPSGFRNYAELAAIILSSR